MSVGIMQMTSGKWREFDVVEVDHDYRVVGFQEKLARLSMATI